MNSLKRQLTKTISIEILPVGQENEVKDRVWAINWFNYKTKWLYSLYNKLAAKHVVKMGGQLLFKGHKQRTIFGDEKLARETLLIVTYPQINNFLDMVTIKAFQLVSLLRVRAVKDFVFGFTKRIDKHEIGSIPKFNGSDSYLVFHYQGNVDQEKLYDLALENGVKVFFHGEKMAWLKRIEDGKDDVIVPFFMDGIIVLQAENDQAIEEFVSSEELNMLRAGNTTDYAAVFTRVK